MGEGEERGRRCGGETPNLIMLTVLDQPGQYEHQEYGQ